MLDAIKQRLAWREPLFSPSNDIARRKRAQVIRETLGCGNGTVAAKTFVFLSQEFPPHKVGGVGRYIDQLTRALAEQGLNIHVVTPAQTDQTAGLALENGVWVHRISGHAYSTPKGLNVPPHIWSHSRSMLEEIRCLSKVRPVDCVYAPIWDCEGVAVLEDGVFPLVTGLQTMLRFWAPMHPELSGDPAFANGFLKPMQDLEKRLLTESTGLHAISCAIARDIAETYGAPIDGDRVRIAPLGLDDWSSQPFVRAPYPSDAIHLLFVGRLEKRKGVDLLLAITPELLDAWPSLHIHFVGDDTQHGPDGRSYRAAFEAEASPAHRARAHFHGATSDAELRGFYRDCDIFVAPSRFESFGLILVEAMIFGKPVVACRVGGMPEVVAENETALLAEPGDAQSLKARLTRLIGDADLRARLGRAGRERYVRHFSPSALAASIGDFMSETQSRHRQSR